MDSLKKCIDCGLEAHNEKDLEAFVSNSRHPLGKTNLCKSCYMERYYYRKRPLKSDVPYLRKCTECGLIAWEETDLELFCKDNRNKRGYKNLCRECFNAMSRVGGKYYERVAEYKHNRQDSISKRRIRFKDKRIYFPFKIRDGICSICGKKYPEDLDRRTILHHEKYDEQNPLNHTIEVCLSCHNRIHNEMRRNEKIKR